MFSSRQQGSIYLYIAPCSELQNRALCAKTLEPSFLMRNRAIFHYSRSTLSPKIKFSLSLNFPKNQNPIFIIPHFPQKSKSQFIIPHPYPFHLVSIISPSCHQLSQIWFQKSTFPSHNNSRQSYPHDSPSSHRFQVHLFTNQVLYCVICSI